MSRRLAQGYVGGDGQHKDASLIHHKRQPDVAIKPYHDHFSTPQNPYFYQHLLCGIIAKAGRAMQEKLSCAIVSLFSVGTYGNAGPWRNGLGCRLAQRRWATIGPLNREEAPRFCCGIAEIAGIWRAAGRVPYYSVDEPMDGRYTTTLTQTRCEDAAEALNSGGYEKSRLNPRSECIGVSRRYTIRRT